ncbi:hypothetical protein [Bremerella cremea]|nr:hypothetical protein [Bremerella cremea]
MPKYKLIANKFSLGKLGLKEYFGPVIASSDAFFLVIRMSEAAALAGSLGGVLGSVLVNTASKFIPGKRSTMEIDLCDLPIEITSDPDWPQIQLDGRVIIIPRSVIVSTHYPWWGALRIETSERRFNITPSFFYRGGVVKFLREHGWHV